MTGLARLSVDERPGNRLRLVLTCPHGTSKATLLTVAEDWTPDVAAVLPVFASWHEWMERCGCAASVTNTEARA